MIEGYITTQQRREYEKKHGGHVTRYGNHYTSEEWATEQAGYQAEQTVRDSYVERMEAMYQVATEKLKALGITNNTRKVIEHIWENGTEEITFTSQERKIEVEEINNWMIAQERMIAQELS